MVTTMMDLSRQQSVKTDSRLEGRIACITGAGSGLGRATALRFAATGARIVCADVNPGAESIDIEVNKKYGNDRAIFVKVNVMDEEEIQAMVKKTVEWGGRIDIIVNYAGIAAEARHGGSKRLHEFPTEDFDKTIAINTRGVWLCCKYAIKQMLDQEPLPPNARGERIRGWIVNAASILGLVGGPGTPAYVPSKHAVVGMTKQIAIDYAADKIHCNAVCPGYVKTPMTADITATKAGEESLIAIHPWNSLGRPEDIADAALFLSSDES